MIYFNHAATGFPKFPAMLSAMKGSLVSGELSTNRDSVVSADIKQKVFALRNEISKLLKAKQPHEIVFTASDTIALNMLMQGLPWRAGDILLIDAMSHNAIARPAEAIHEKHGVRVIPIASADDLRLAVLRYGSAIKAAVFSHGSNVTGDVIKARTIGNILYENGIPFILDAAQTIGLHAIDVELYHASAVAFAGHKGLNGPQGTGGFYIRKSFHIQPILFGGTGTESMSLSPEIIYPESFEVGTPAMHDLMGLHEAIRVINEKFGGVRLYREKAIKIAQYACDELQKIPQVIVYGKKIKELPVVSFNVRRYSCKEIGDLLAQHGIICRTGIHCAGLAIRQLGCENEYGGTVRVSFGSTNTKKEVDKMIAVLKERLASDTLTKKDIKKIMKHVEENGFVKEPKLVGGLKRKPFPQANTLDRVETLICHLAQNDVMLREDIAELFQFTIRQADLYGHAAQYLGFAKRVPHGFAATAKGKKFLAMPRQKRSRAIVKAMLEHKPFYLAAEYYLKHNELPYYMKLCGIMKDCHIIFNEYRKEDHQCAVMISRRGESMMRWVDTVFENAEAM